MNSPLPAAMNSVNWNGNVATFLVQEIQLTQIDAACSRLAVWSRQLEIIDRGNPAISFVRAMQSAAHQAVSSIGLGLYWASASSIRSVLENALYYTYFRVHPVELSSLVSNDSYYVSKTEILDFHQVHTRDFKKLQATLGLLSRLDAWYSQISAIVHGQVPGVWLKSAGISDTKFNEETLKDAVAKLCEAELIVHHLFLITFARHNWSEFSHASKRFILKGMSGDQKASLGLDLL